MSLSAGHTGVLPRPEAARSATGVLVHDAGQSLLSATEEVTRRASKRQPEPATPRSAIRGWGPYDPGRGVLLGDTFGSMTERATSAGDGSGPETRYHLLTTDGGIVADQPGKMAGEAAIGVVLKAPLEEISEPIGPVKDHHVAEYRAFIRGLEAARSRGIRHLRVCLDSALLVNQLNGRWKVKAEHLRPLHEQAVSLIQQFADIKITWVPRKANAEADALASTPLGPLRPKPKPSIDELPLD
jgi:ribonuclease HI